MAVYIDDRYLHPMGSYGRMKMSHMIADTDTELHAMAVQIGMRRTWYQAPPHHDSHYDVSLSKRELALKYGAIAITLRQCAAMNWRRRLMGKLGSPQEAEQFMREFRGTTTNPRARKP